MDWYKHFNYSDVGNGSVRFENPLIDERSYFGSNLLFGANSLFGDSPGPDLMSNVFREICKSSIITIISLAGLSKLKPSNLRSNVFCLVEATSNICVAIAFYLSFLILLAPFTVYRLFVQIYFKLFKQGCTLMHGTDAVWCMDNKEARSIVNILVMLEINKTDEDLVEATRDIMEKLCYDHRYGFKFTSYKRESQFGYYYWEKGDEAMAKNCVNYIDKEIKTENDLIDFISARFNREIGDYGWEVLVCNDNLQESKLRPLIFRLHHSIGDGASLIQAFVNSIADQNRSRITLSQAFNVSFQPKDTNFRFSIPEKEPIDVRVNKLIESVKSIVYKIPAFVHGPGNYLKMVFTQNEKSQLLVNKLSGDKILVWYNGEDLLKNIKTIKTKMGVSFSEVVFALLSNSIERYLEKRGGAPNSISVVVPIIGEGKKSLKVASEIVREGNNIKVSRLTETDGGMTNGFWVAVFKLPVKSTCANSLVEKLTSVRSNSRKFIGSPEFITFKLMIDFVITLVPGMLVMPILDMVKTQMVFTNLPGPTNELKIAGNPVKKLAFWAPNRGCTGFGVSLLSTNGRLSLGIVADKAVIPSQDDLQSILDDFLHSVKTESSSI